MDRRARFSVFPILLLQMTLFQICHYTSLVDQDTGKVLVPLDFENNGEIWSNSRSKCLSTSFQGGTAAVFSI
jgi:hypothetical protein